MRPLRSFLLLLIILGILTGLSFVLPERKLAPLPNEFVPAFPTLKGSDKQFRNPGNQLMPAPDTLPQQEPDTVINKDALISSSESRQADLLAPFLDSLSNSNGQTRILYYGDSQVEGDRITFFLRQLLRKRRGGTGPGLFLPVMPVMYTKSIWLKSTPNWERYTYLSFRSGEISHNRLGPLMAFCRYLPEGKTSSSPEKASVRIRPSDFADSATATFDLLRIIYSNSSGVVKITVRNDENQFVSDTLGNCAGLKEVKYNISGAKDITIGFEGLVSPDIYGISIETPRV